MSQKVKEAHDEARRLTSEIKGSPEEQRIIPLCSVSAPPKLRSIEIRLRFFLWIPNT
jgi:hypothetical protein